MMVAIPVADFCGLESPIHGHFGSAACFAIVDTDSMTVECLSNRDRGHARGACSPLAALGGRSVDTVIVGDIGSGALLRLRQASIAVCRAPGGTVGEVVRLFKAGHLDELQEQATCAGRPESSSCHRTCQDR